MTRQRKPSVLSNHRHGLSRKAKFRNTDVAGDVGEVIYFNTTPTLPIFPSNLKWRRSSHTATARRTPHQHPHRFGPHENFRGRGRGAAGGGILASRARIACDSAGATKEYQTPAIGKRMRLLLSRIKHRVLQAEHLMSLWPGSGVFPSADQKPYRDSDKNPQLHVHPEEHIVSISTQSAAIAAGMTAVGCAALPKATAPLPGWGSK